MITLRNRLSILPPILFFLILASAAFSANMGKSIGCRVALCMRPALILALITVCMPSRAAAGSFVDPVRWLPESRPDSVQSWSLRAVAARVDLLRLIAPRCRLAVSLDALGDIPALVAVEGSMSCRDVVRLVLATPALPETAIPDGAPCPAGRACYGGQVY